MAVISGKYAEVLFGTCNFLEFESWDLEYGSNIEEYNSRAGAGAGQTVDGVHTGSGSVTGFMDPDAPITTQVTTGSLLAIYLYLTSTGPVQTYGNGRIGKYSLSANRDGTPEPVTIPFVTDGVWTLP